MFFKLFLSIFFNIELIKNLSIFFNIELVEILVM